MDDTNLSARKLAILRGEFFPDLSEVCEWGTRRIAVHVQKGERLPAYRVWRQVWNQILYTQFDRPEVTLLPTTPVDMLLPEEIANALNRLDIDCVEDFDGWTQRDLLESRYRWTDANGNEHQKHNQIGPGHLKLIVDMLAKHGIDLPE